MQHMAHMSWHWKLAVIGTHWNWLMGLRGWHCSWIKHSLSGRQELENWLITQCKAEASQGKFQAA